MIEKNERGALTPENYWDVITEHQGDTFYTK